MLYRLIGFLGPVAGSVRNRINRFEAARVAVLSGATGGALGLGSVVVALVLHLMGVPVTAGQIAALFALVGPAVAAATALVDGVRRTFLHEAPPAVTLPFPSAR